MRVLVAYYTTLHPALSVRQSIGLSVRRSVGPSVCPSVRLSVRPSVCPSITLYFFGVFVVYGLTAPMYVFVSFLFILNFSPSIVACTRLYNLLCPLVSWLVERSVGRLTDASKNQNNSEIDNDFHNYWVA